VKPTTTKAALVRIGLHAARDLLLQVVYERSSDLPLFRDEVAACFERSVRVAHACRQIAALVRPSFDLAYLCGLLHDIGEARIYRVLSRMPEARTLSPAVIGDLVQRHHTRAGADVARTWSLPNDIVQACEDHHQPTRASFPGRIVMAGAALVRLATQPEIAGHAEREVLAELGVTPQQIEALVQAHLAIAY
jgi:putative nucleotidyltransferase with HDIG domain